jgi:hypothetical protein
MPDLYLADRRPAAGRDHRFQAVCRALAHLDLPADDRSFDDLLFALAQIERPRCASFEPLARAAA